MANLSRSKKYTSAEERRSSIDNAFDALNTGGTPVTVKDLAEYNNVSQRCIRDRLKELENDYWVHQGIVGRRDSDSADS